MRRAILWLGLPMCMIFLLSCTTDLEETTAEGIWDSVGELQRLTGGVKLYLTAGPSGTVTGQWQRGASSSSVTGMTDDNGAIWLTLTGFNAGQAAHFEGEFTDAFRIEGELGGVDLSEEPAVFRRASFSP